MKESLELLTVSLRVLTAINNKQPPAQSDIDILIAFAGARPAGIGLDEFVCDVVQSAVDMRAIARNSQITPDGSDGTKSNDFVIPALTKNGKQRSPRKNGVSQHMRLPDAKRAAESDAHSAGEPLPAPKRYATPRG